MPWEAVISTAVVCILALIVPIVIATEGRQKEKAENLQQLTPEPVEQDPNQDLYDRIEQAVQDYRKKNAT